MIDSSFCSCICIAVQYYVTTVHQIPKTLFKWILIYTVYSIQHQKLDQKELRNTRKPVVKVYSSANFIYGVIFPTFPISENFNILLQTVVDRFFSPLWSIIKRNGQWHCSTQIIKFPMYNYKCPNPNLNLGCSVLLCYKQSDELLST